jgi:hypothetical protein
MGVGVLTATDADAVIKCFATAISTALLLYISPILFGVSMTAMVIPGTLVVFLATWLYMEGTPAKDPNAAPPVPPQFNLGALSKFTGAVSSMIPERATSRPVGLSMRTIFTLIIIGSLTFWNNSTAPISKEETEQTIGLEEPETIYPEILPELQNTTTLISPFGNSMAYVRFNSNARKDRIPYAMAYKPFFHTVHLSIPNYPEDRKGKFYSNLTHDSWDNGHVMYQGVAETMRIILEESNEEVFHKRQTNSSSNSTATSSTPPVASENGARPASEIDGIMFYHFDAWIDPLGFSDEDPSRIWFPGAWSQEPKYQCINDTKVYHWTWWDEHHDKKALAAMQTIRNLELGFTLLPHQQFCTG